MQCTNEIREAVTWTKRNVRRTCMTNSATALAVVLNSVQTALTFLVTGAGKKINAPAMISSELLFGLLSLKLA